MVHIGTPRTDIFRFGRSFPTKYGWRSTSCTSVIWLIRFTSRYCEVLHCSFIRFFSSSINSDMYLLFCVKAGGFSILDFDDYIFIQSFEECADNFSSYLRSTSVRLSKLSTRLTVAYYVLAECLVLHIHDHATGFMPDAWEYLRTDRSKRLLFGYFHLDAPYASLSFPFRLFFFRQYLPIPLCLPEFRLWFRRYLIIFPSLCFLHLLLRPSLVHLQKNFIFLCSRSGWLWKFLWLFSQNCTAHSLLLGSTLNSLIIYGSW